MRIDISNANPPFFEELNGKTNLYFTFLVFPKTMEKTIFLQKIHFSFQEYFNPNVFIINEGEKKPLDKVRLEGEEMLRLNMVFENLPPTATLFKDGFFESILKIYFLNAKEEEIPISFKFAGKKVVIDEKRVALEELKFKRCASNTVYFSLFFIVGILVLLNVWISQHNDVFNQVIPSIFANVFLTAITLYLGFELGNLRHLFTNLRSTKDFLNTTELYFERDTLNLLKGKKFAALAGVGFFFMLLVPCWYFFPVSLDIPADKYQSYIYQPQEKSYVRVNAPKVYWKDLDSLKITNPLPKLKYDKAPVVAATINDIQVPLLTHFISDSTSVREMKYKVSAIAGRKLNLKASEISNFNYSFYGIKEKCESEGNASFCDLVKLFEQDSSIYFFDKNVIRDKELEGEKLSITTRILNDLMDTRKVDIWGKQGANDYLESNFKRKVYVPDTIYTFLKGEFQDKWFFQDNSGEIMSKLATYEAVVENIKDKKVDLEQDSVTIKVKELLGNSPYRTSEVKPLLEFMLVYYDVFNSPLKGSGDVIERLLRFRIPNPVNGEIQKQIEVMDILLDLLDKKPSTLDTSMIKTILRGSENWGLTKSNGTRREYISKLVELMRISNKAGCYDCTKVLHEVIAKDAIELPQIDRYYFRAFIKAGIKTEAYQKEYFLKYICKTGRYPNPPQENNDGSEAISEPETWREWILSINSTPDQWVLKQAETYGDRNTFLSKCL